MWTIDTSILILIGVFIFAGLSIYCFKAAINFFKHQQIITNFAEYSSVLQYYMEKAYDMVHKDRILVYSLEATRVPEEEINVVSKDFINLVEKLLGPRLLGELLFLYGNYETFAFVLAEYFSTRYEEDEIRKSAVNEMMESDSQLET